ARMAFSIAVRAKPRGAARSCSHSCSVRFEICNFNAASFARDYSARATLVIFVETHRLRTSDAERDQGVSQKPSLHAIRESRIALRQRGETIDSNCIPHSRPSGGPSISSRPPHFDSFAAAHSGIRPVHCAALGASSELVVLVFE